MKKTELKKQPVNKISRIIILLMIGLLIGIYASSLSCFQHISFLKNGIPPNELCFAVVTWHNFNTLFIPAALTNDPRWILAFGLFMWTVIVFFVVKFIRK